MANSALKYTLIAAISATAYSAFYSNEAEDRPTDNQDDPSPIVLPIDSPKQKTAAIDTPLTAPKLRYNFQDQSVQDPLNYPNGGGLKLKDPSNIKKDVQYDPTTGQYEITQKIGNEDYRPPTYMTPEEYEDYIIQQKIKSYWGQRTKAEDVKKGNRSLIPTLHVGGEYFDRIFGGNTVDIRPQGTAELIFGLNNSTTQNPALPVNQRSITTFNFNEKIQLNVVGKIGEKLKLTTNYNTEATFDFENQMKIEYNGLEDEIIKKIEAGNVSLPLTGSLISSSTSLFGIKTQMQFGRLTATAVLSQDKGKKSVINVSGGAQTTNFSITGDQYEANRDYFLAQYFRDRFDTAMGSLPVILSDVIVTRVEVYVTNRTNTVVGLRNIVGFADLGEDKKHSSPLFKENVIHDVSPTSVLPYNTQNDEYHQVADTISGYLKDRNFNTVTTKLPAWYVNARDYENVNLARMLAPTEYTFNPKLGFISLNQALNYDQVLAVAFQYTYNGKVYQVGEFSTDGIVSPKPLFLKLLKGTVTNPQLPIWNLMMKNIYSIGGYQINPQNFVLNILYNNISTGVNINYFPDGPVSGKPLVQVFGLDRLNSNGDAIPDGAFDFLDGVTIMSASGRIIFPSVEPFGSYLINKQVIRKNPNDSTYAKKYGFKQLYDSTLIVAQQFPQLNRFTLSGSFKSSSSSDISLNTVNVPQGSVTVTAGGIKLTENVDYTVDYTLGRVKIINQGILSSGTPIQISLESNALFALQTKTLMGANFDYKVNKDFNIGGTILNLNEHPLTQKVNIGDEPIDNTIIGVNSNYRTAVPFITQLVNRLPFINTKAPSNFVASGEAARLFPGHNRAIGSGAAGDSYIDDFEGSISNIDLKQPQSWNLASIPQGQPTVFPEASLNDSAAIGYNRALLNWYILDPLFLRQTNGLTPSSITLDSMSNNQTREVLETEIFPNEQLASGLPTNTPMFDLAYYPYIRGPYNYDVKGYRNSSGTVISNGINSNGSLNLPATRWGGIMRAIQTNDFEATNIEYLELWMMDPFNKDNHNPNTSGNLYINLGDVSEDVMKDSRKSFENGLPIDAANSTGVPCDTTNLARVSDIQSLVNAFDVNASARPFQDVGLDGFSDAQEAAFPTARKYLANIAAAFGTSSQAYQRAVIDPSGDDYNFYRGSAYDDLNAGVLTRYLKYNGYDGNSPQTGQSDNVIYGQKQASYSPESYTTSATTLPNTEDINNDNTLSENEGYYQYKVSLKPSDFNTVGNNYIADILSTNGQNIKNGAPKPIKWYQLKIPIHSFDTKVGSISDFRSIRFLRMYFKGVDQPIVCRFARMQFVRSSWIIYPNSLLSDGEYLATDGGGASFSLSSVSIVANGTQAPVNYVLPPGIQRTVNVQSSNLAQQNEQSLAMQICGLQDGDAKACYRNMNFDIRNYKTIQMFAHAEAPVPNTTDLKSNDLRWFIRLGSDFTDNYYEYEIPLQVTPGKNYNGGLESDQYAVWPLANQLDLAFAKLIAAKQERDIAINSKSASTTLRYPVSDGNNTIYIMGSPNLGGITTIMIGVRNPKRQPGVPGDDGLQKCATVWVDELRLSGFNESGGWAALGRAKVDLADLGSLSLAGNYSTPGWGGLEQTMAQRQLSTNFGYDFSSNFELGKFTPAKLGIKIPMYAGISEGIIIPEYNPLDPDINLKTVLNDPSIPKSQRDSLGNATIDYTLRKSLNFTNVKKERSKTKKNIHIYDIENFSFTYSYTEIDHRDINTLFNNTRTYHAGLIYSYTPVAKSLKPFAKTKLNPKYFALIKDLNFSPLPTNLGFSSNVDRYFNESQIRDNTGDLLITPLYNKTFTMNRLYNMNWALTKGLKVDFSATNNSRIFEPYGSLDTKAQRDSVVNNLLGLGTTTEYKHNLNVNYAVPINKLPFLDFVNSTVHYTGSYDWMHAPFAADSLGNTIQNSRSWQFNGQFNMSTLYNKISYFKKLALKPLFINPEDKKKEEDKKKKEIEKLDLAIKKAISDTSRKAKKTLDSLKTAKAKLKGDNQYEILDYLGRLIISVKNITLSYSDNRGTTLPGYAQSTQILGMDPRFSGPTPGFVFGSQANIIPEAMRDDWLVKTSTFSSPYITNSAQTFTGRMNVELIPDLKIELNVNRTYSENFSEYIVWNPTLGPHGRYDTLTPTQTGNFSMSFITIKTAFERDNSTHTSQNWENFLNYRATISTFLGQNYNQNHSLPRIGPTASGYIDGYGPASQSVVIPAFIAAYEGHSPRPGDLTLFPLIPLPNWRITYDGLAKFPAIKKHFKSITLSSAYRSSYNIASFTQNLDYVSDNKDDGLTTVRDATENFIPKLSIASVSISEQFSPLIKIETVWNNSLISSLEIRKERSLALQMSDISLQELESQAVVIGGGYRFSKVKIRFIRIGGKPLPPSDMNLKVDLSFTNNITIMRQSDPDVSQATSGQNIITLKNSLDYKMNDRLTIRIFFDRIMNNPVISSSFPTSNTNAGFSLRFTLTG